MQSAFQPVVVDRFASQRSGYDTTIGTAASFGAPAGGFAEEIGWDDSDALSGSFSLDRRLHSLHQIREDKESRDQSTQCTDLGGEEDDGKAFSSMSRFKTFVKSRSRSFLEKSRSFSSTLPALLQEPRRRPWESEMAFSARAFRGQSMWRDLKRRVKNLFYI